MHACTGCKLPIPLIDRPDIASWLCHLDLQCVCGVPKECQSDLRAYESVVWLKIDTVPFPCFIFGPARAKRFLNNGRYMRVVRYSVTYYRKRRGQIRNQLGLTVFLFAFWPCTDPLKVLAPGGGRQTPLINCATGGHEQQGSKKGGRAHILV